MSFRNIKNPSHKQHNPKTKLKCLIYLVQFVYKNVYKQFLKMSPAGQLCTDDFRYIENAFFMQDGS